MKERNKKDLRLIVDTLKTREFRVESDNISIGTGSKLKVGDKESIEIDTHTVNHDLKTHIEHSLRMPDDWFLVKLIF